MNRSEKREGYDVALVCENGHEVNAASQGMPEFNAKGRGKNNYQVFVVIHLLQG